MFDTLRHDTTSDDSTRQNATHHDKQYRLTPKHVVDRLAEAGVPRGERTVQRWCAAGDLDCIEDDQMGYFIAEESVDNKVIQLKQLLELEERRQAAPVTDSPRHDTTSRVLTHQDIQSAATPTMRDEPRHAATRHDAADAVPLSAPEATPPATIRHDATIPDMSSDDDDKTQQAGEANRGFSGLEIFEHPYVKKLENQIDRLEQKLDAQVLTTQQIQEHARQQLVELQQASQVAQSRTLGEYLLELAGLKTKSEPLIEQRGIRTIDRPFARPQEDRNSNNS